MLQLSKLKFYTIFFLATAFLFTGCDESEDDEMELPTILFDSATLPGTYHMTFSGEDGIHSYDFDQNGTVLINYADQTVDTEDWSVNSIGQLVITGSVNDLFTLTSGSQASGTFVAFLREAGETDTDNPVTGTIEQQ